jgi:UDP-2,3-diacylglucosamine hydrolase
MKTVSFSANSKLYFASDFHLGAPNKDSSNERENRIIRWLIQAAEDADAFFLVGDVFDFWFEYASVVPKGFVRFQAAIAHITDRGIPVYFFHGNHDMWMNKYFEEELGVQIITDLLKITIGDQSLLIGHGDGLGPGDQTYKFLKKIFKNPIAKWFFRWLHPDIGVSVATAWSSKSRLNNIKKGGEEFQNENEWLYQFALDFEAKQHHDFYIFGHRHLPIEMNVGDRSIYINLGEWVNYNTYCEFENSQAKLLTFEK